MGTSVAKSRGNVVKFNSLWSVDSGHPVAGVKVSRNAVPGPGKLGLVRSGCKIIGFHSRNLRSWAKQVSNLRYSNPNYPIVNESFKFHIFTITNFTMLIVFTTKLKKHIMKSCLIHSVDH